MSEAAVKASIDSRGVARVTLNRPDKHNAFDDTVIRDLRKAFDALAKREDVRVVILRSEGKSFSAGADLNWMKRMAKYDFGHNMKDAEALAGMLKALYQMPQPTIAQVQGAAYGGAVGLVACCDMAVGNNKATFCLSEVKIGLIPATISPYVIRAIGERASRRYFTTAESFDAATALRLGLLTELAPNDELDSVTEHLVEPLLQNGPMAIRAAKDLIASVAGKDIDDELLKDTSARIAHIRVAEEGQEGLGSFLGMRKPNWLKRKK